MHLLNTFSHSFGRNLGVILYEYKDKNVRITIINFSICIVQINHFKMTKIPLKQKKLKKKWYTGWIASKFEAYDLHTMLYFFIKFHVKLNMFTPLNYSQNVYWVSNATTSKLMGVICMFLKFKRLKSNYPKVERGNLHFSLYFN